MLFRSPPAVSPLPQSRHPFPERLASQRFCWPFASLRKLGKQRFPNFRNLAGCCDVWAALREPRSNLGGPTWILSRSILLERRPRSRSWGAAPHPARGLTPLDRASRPGAVLGERLCPEPSGASALPNSMVLPQAKTPDAYQAPGAKNPRISAVPPVISEHAHAYPLIASVRRLCV